MEVQHFKATSQRLEPLRRFLTDIATVAEQAVQAVQMTHEKESELKDLEGRVLQVQVQLGTLMEAMQAAEEKAKEAEAQTKARVEAANTEAALRIREMQHTADEECRRLQEALAQAQIAHRSKIGLLREEQKVAEENLEVTKNALQEIYKRINMPTQAS